MSLIDRLSRRGVMNKAQIPDSLEEQTMKLTENLTDITVILDRSGSMGAIRRQTEQGFDGFIAEQRHVESPCRVSLIQFDHQYTPVYREKSIHRVPRLRLRPRGSTALYDAMGKAIIETDVRIRSTPLRRRPSQVMIVTITDGMENSSHEFTRERINDLIQAQKSNFDWQFVYLGANQDAIREAAEYGISADCAMTFSASEEGTEHLWDAMGMAVARHRKAMVMGDAGCFAFSEKEREINDGGRK